MTLDDLLASLHTELAKSLLARVREGDCPAAILKEARELLKDNGVQADPVANKPLRNLAKELPFDEEEDHIH